MVDEPDALEIAFVVQALAERYGYDFRGYEAGSLSRRLSQAASHVGAAHLGDLLHRILRDPDVVPQVLDVLTVRVTDMFRDPEFHLAFRQKVVPILRTYPQLKLWHAGCASGEEAYAMAILLAEEGLIARSHIYATDVSATAIRQAREGVYPASVLDCFASNYSLAGGRGRVEDYFCEAYGGITIREDLRKSVHFFQHDLVSDYTLGEMHVICCRNVMIYFGQDLRSRVLSMFTSELPRGGFICLGASESLPVATQALFDGIDAGQRIFRYRGAT